MEGYLKENPERQQQEDFSLTIDEFGSFRAVEREKLGLNATIHRTLKSLDRLEENKRYADPELQVFVRSLRMLVVALQSGLGECRLATPFSSLRPIIDDKGLHWCCTHDPEHCS
jgi:hypothetical protein